MVMKFMFWQKVNTSVAIFLVACLFLYIEMLQSNVCLRSNNVLPCKLLDKACMWKTNTANYLEITQS